uniref:Hypotheticial protein n=1 Tax=Schistosoma japonicum TaxID=6182 RepID=C7TXY0_SCHJA|nr:hypotheticial protein [Schistosoma japonicum]
MSLSGYTFFSNVFSVYLSHRPNDCPRKYVGFNNFNVKHEIFVG